MNLPNWFFIKVGLKCTHCLHFDTSSRIWPGYILNLLFNTFILYTQTMNMFFDSKWIIFIYSYSHIWSTISRCFLFFFDTKKIKTLLYYILHFPKTFSVFVQLFQKHPLLVIHIVDSWYRVLRLTHYNKTLCTTK